MKIISLITLISILSFNCCAMELAKSKEAAAVDALLMDILAKDRENESLLWSKITYEEDSLSQAMKKNDLEAVEKLLHKEERENNDDFGITSVHLAVEKGYIDVIRFLIERGLNINHESMYHVVPLSAAAEKPNRAEVINVLCELGAFVNFQDSWYKSSPLHSAVRRGYSENIKALLKQPEIDVTLKNGDGRTPLEEAEALGYNAIVALLKNYTEHIG